MYGINLKPHIIRPEADRSIVLSICTWSVIDNTQHSFYLSIQPTSLIAIPADLMQISDAQCPQWPVAAGLDGKLLAEQGLIEEESLDTGLG